MNIIEIMQDAGNNETGRRKIHEIIIKEITISKGEKKERQVQQIIRIRKGSQEKKREIGNLSTTPIEK